MSTLDTADVLASLTFDDRGLIPAVAQQSGTGEVLMLAWMSERSLALTLETGWATYFSRSRGELWRKGETSGHLQRVLSIAADCDGDTLLLEVEQTGPACHTGTTACFTGRQIADLRGLRALDTTTDADLAPADGDVTTDAEAAR